MGAMLHLRAIQNHKFKVKSWTIHSIIRSFWSYYSFMVPWVQWYLYIPSLLVKNILCHCSCNPSALSPICFLYFMLSIFFRICLAVRLIPYSRFTSSATSAYIGCERWSVPLSLWLSVILRQTASTQAVSWPVQLPRRGLRIGNGYSDVVECDSWSIGGWRNRGLLVICFRKLNVLIMVNVQNCVPAKLHSKQPNSRSLAINAKVNC